MDKVIVARDALISTLTENRAKHKTAYDEACAGYQRAAIKELNREIGAIQNDKTHRIVISEFPPLDHTADYDKALRMLKLSVQEVVEISGQDFSRFVDDDWDWKKVWSASTTKYLRG